MFHLASCYLLFNEGGRDPEKVADVLKLKLEYCKAKKNELKKEYRKEKKHLEECHQREGQQRKFRKIISRIAKQAQDRWAKGLKKLSDKIEWAEKKFKPPEPASAFKDWAKRIATGRGKGRQKHRFKVKCYGGSRVDKNEKDCLSLPPKTMTYPEVKRDDVKLNQDMGNHKARYTRARERDFDMQGNDVTEEQGKNRADPGAGSGGEQAQGEV